MIFCMFVLIIGLGFIYFIVKKKSEKKERSKEFNQRLKGSLNSNVVSVNVKGNANNINVKQSTSNVKSTFQGSQAEAVSSINKNNEDLNNLLLSTTLLRSENNFTICSAKPEKTASFTSSATDGIGICRDNYDARTDSYRPPVSHDCHSSKSSYTSSDNSSSSCDSYSSSSSSDYSSSGSSYDSSSSSSSSSWD